ncbi:MAG: hypothetical protein HOV80_13475 [Polyangiaceae bacterium]|nr:hypothetical protein [Polyangiaceae bacterium]
MNDDFRKDVTAQAPGMVGPRIPAPPPALGRRAGRNNARGIIWLLALALGIAGGVCAYQFAPMVDTTFDYWVSLALD